MANICATPISQYINAPVIALVLRERTEAAAQSAKSAAVLVEHYVEAAVKMNAKGEREVSDEDMWRLYNYCHTAWDAAERARTCADTCAEICGNTMHDPDKAAMTAAHDEAQASCKEAWAAEVLAWSIIE